MSTMQNACRSVTLVVALVGALTACATAPRPAEIEVARVALQEARDAGAEQRVTRRFDEAAQQLARAERTWQEEAAAELSAHQARLAEVMARDAQYRARLMAADEALARNRERLARTERQVKDTEVALLEVQTALREATRRTQESEARARQAQQRLTEQVGRLERELERRTRDLRATTEQSAADREQAVAEITTLRDDLAKARTEAEAAVTAAELERQRLEEQQRVSEARAADLARLQQDQTRLQQGQDAAREELRATLAQLAEVRKEPRGLVVSLPGSIYFDFDKADVRSEMQGRLVEIARTLAKLPQIMLQVEGHTDSDGSNEYNLQLSRRRAESVRELLVAGGVSDERVQAVGYGEARPRVPNTTPAAKAQNRRVEIVVDEGPR